MFKDESQNIYLTNCVKIPPNDMSDTLWYINILIVILTYMKMTKKKFDNGNSSYISINNSRLLQLWALFLSPGYAPWESPQEKQFYLTHKA